MDDPNIIMEEYIKLEEEKARRRGRVFNWQTATYGKIRIDDDLHDLSSVEAEFPAIVINDAFAPQDALQCKSQVSTPFNDEIDFRISFDESDDEDYTIICDKNSFSYKMISVNNLKTDSEKDNEKVIPSIPSPEPAISCFDDLDFFKDFENEFPAIVYNDAKVRFLYFVESLGKIGLQEWIQRIRVKPIRLRMTKVIKGEFEKIMILSRNVSLTFITQLEVFNNEVNRLSRMVDDLFTYEVKVANIPCDSKMDDDSEHEADDDLGIPGDDEDEIAEVFRIDTNIFDYETPLCSAFNEFNYLLKDYEWYEAMQDSELKDEALRNKAIMEGPINEDDDESR
ncbi:hypothetical protein Tco_0286313 [Tanacetum coccineum]